MKYLRIFQPVILSLALSTMVFQCADELEEPLQCPQVSKSEDQNLIGIWEPHNFEGQTLLIFDENGFWKTWSVHQNTWLEQGTYQLDRTVLTLWNDQDLSRSERIAIKDHMLFIYVSDDTDRPLIYQRRPCP